MIEIKNSEGIITKVYAATFENEAYKQVKELIEYEPYKHSKIRLMPDAHAGKGCTVGTTMVIKDAITPNLVGVDINCAMLMVELKTDSIDLAKLDSVIKNYIPSGFDVHKTSKAKFNFDNLCCIKSLDLGRAMLSIGSLGGGNHFIEIGKSFETGKLYLVIHSGSRKLGTDVCTYHQNIAFQSLNEVGKAKEAMIESLKSQGRNNEIAQALKNFQKPSANKDLAGETAR